MDSSVLHEPLSPPDVFSVPGPSGTAKHLKVSIAHFQVSCPTSSNQQYAPRLIMGARLFYESQRSQPTMISWSKTPLTPRTCGNICEKLGMKYRQSKDQIQQYKDEAQVRGSKSWKHRSRQKQAPWADVPGQIILRENSDQEKTSKTVNLLR